MRATVAARHDNLATVYIADWGANRQVEMVESVQPPQHRNKKWVLIISTSFGCPGGCLMCDAGSAYHGRLSAEQLLEQIDFLVEQYYPDRRIPSEKFKVQFARMGDPALNPAVLEVLALLPGRYVAPGLLPCLSTIAPKKSDHFFDGLLALKRQWYANGRFQMQFSLHTTDPQVRDRIMPLPKWGLESIASYGRVFFAPGDRKIALNFALAKDIPVDPNVIAASFDPERFVIKLTPLNPTYAAAAHALESVSADLSDSRSCQLIDSLRRYGFEVIVSVGEREENQIGSNCGQYVTRFLQADETVREAYGAVPKSMNAPGRP